MRIEPPSQEQDAARRWVFHWTLLALAGGIFLLVLFSFSKKVENDDILRDRQGVSRAPPLDEIGWGPLSLGGIRSLGPVPNLARELVLIGRNGRPDAQKDSALLLGLKSTAQEKLVASGDLVYLKQQGGDTFVFSENQTDLAIRPLGMEGEGALVEVMRAGHDGPQRGEVVLSYFAHGGLEDEPYWKALQSAQSWGPDLFLQRFGGSDYQSLLFKHKLKIGDEVFFLAEGDLLAWESEGWSLKTSPEAPIAKVASIGPRGMQIQVWDESGFHSERITLPIQQAPRQTIKAEELMKKVRPRAATEISCLLGSRRAIVKEGDWWVKTAAGWKILKTIADIEDFIHHRLHGELFIFEQIETDKGHIVIRGHYFDAMRTIVQPLALNLSPEKKNVAALARKIAKASPKE